MAGAIVFDKKTQGRIEAATRQDGEHTCGILKRSLGMATYAAFRPPPNASDTVHVAGSSRAPGRTLVSATRLCDSSLRLVSAKRFGGAGSAKAQPDRQGVGMGVSKLG